MTQLVRRVYSSDDVEEVRAAVAEAGAGLVAVGGLERRTYPAQGLETVVAAGEVVLEEGGAVLVRFDPSSISGGG